MHRLFDVIEQYGQARTRDGDNGVGVEAQGRTAHGDLKRGSVSIVPQQAVAEPQRAIIHWSRWRNADRPVAEPPRMILYGGLRAAAHHLYRARAIPQSFKAACPRLSGSERRVIDNLAQVVAVRLHAIEARVMQRIGESTAGCIT